MADEITTSPEVAALEAELKAHDEETARMTTERGADRSQRSAAGWSTAERDAHAAVSNEIAVRRSDERRAIAQRLYAARHPAEAK